MDKLKELIDLCKGGVYVFINEHRSNPSVTILEYLEEISEEGVDPEVLAEMVKTNTIVAVQGYPFSSIGFYRAVHYDIESAAALVIEQINAERN